jgi:geranylgeranyl pyrophosphate synthase
VDIFDKYKSYLDKIDQSLSDSVPNNLHPALKEPIQYFLNLPSKKIRPLLTIISCKILGGKIEDALGAAAAVELFHDFTLIHDDIMDDDELRRGEPTIHIKWDNGTAIMVGDVLIGLALQQLMKSPDQHLNRVTKIFGEALVKVCEGQALDKTFETAPQVNMEAYMEMILNKTAWLFKVSCAMGAIVGDGSDEEIKSISRFGDSLGLAFQIQDDLLDFIADEKELGKRVGSDFKMDKKTYVNLKYQQILNQNPELQKRYPKQEKEFGSFGEFQTALYELGVVEEVEKDIAGYFQTCNEALQTMKYSQPLWEISNIIYQRKF